MGNFLNIGIILLFLVSFGFATHVANDIPTIMFQADIDVPENTGNLNNIVDLFVAANYPRDADRILTFQITNQSNSALIFCFIDAGNFIDCNAPAPNTTGTSTITVRVTDIGGATDTDSFRINVLEDLTANNPPIINLPVEVEVNENSGFQNNLVDLFNFTSDDNDSDSELSFSLIGETNSGLINCFIDSDRFVDCNAPRANSTGSNFITIRVTDTQGLTDTDSFFCYSYCYSKRK